MKRLAVLVLLGIASGDRAPCDLRRRARLPAGRPGITPYGTLDDLVRAKLLDTSFLDVCDGYSFVASPSTDLPEWRWFALATPVGSPHDRPWVLYLQVASSSSTGLCGPHGELSYPCEIHGALKLDPRECKLDGVVACHSTQWGDVYPALDAAKAAD